MSHDAPASDNEGLPTFDAANHARLVTDPARYGYRPDHCEQQTCLGCGKPVTFDADTGAWWIPYAAGNPPTGTFECADRVGVRHLGSLPRLVPDRINADPLLRAIADMVAYVDLHIGKYQIQQLTTVQKELWADIVDANSVLDGRDDPTYLDPDGVPARAPRWWRDDYAGPTAPTDPGFNDEHRYEPDPFA